MTIGSNCREAITKARCRALVEDLAMDPCHDIRRMNNDQKQNGAESKPTILIVEDELFNFIYFSEVLKMHGMESLKAENGEEALNKVKNHPNIDLILMDIKMPFMDGYQAFTEIRKVAPNIPIIAQTAYALSHERKEILAYGFNDYLAKPVEEETLMETVCRHL